jgi:hypothetical protein
MIMSLTLESLVAAIQAVHPRWTITEHGKAQGVTDEWLGIIPLFLNERDERPAAAQINDEYAHGGGWRPMGNDKWTLKRDIHELVYDEGSEDAEHYIPLASAQLRDEKLFFYDCAWVAIVQPDGSFEVARLD